MVCLSAMLTVFKYKKEPENKKYPQKTIMTSEVCSSRQKSFLTLLNKIKCKT